MTDDQLFAQYQKERNAADAATDGVCPVLDLTPAVVELSTDPPPPTEALRAALQPEPWSGAPEDTESTEGRMVASAHAALASACRRPVGIVAEAVARLDDGQRARLVAALQAAL